MLTNKDPPPTPGLERKGPRNMGGPRVKGNLKISFWVHPGSDVNVR